MSADKRRKKKAKQAKVFFNEEYNKISIRDVYRFALKRSEYEDEHPSEKIETQYTKVDD